MRRLIIGVLALFTVISACKKEDQEAKDEKIIQEFIAANSIQGAARTSEGLYYVIVSPGTGTKTYNSSTVVTTKYTGRLLNGQVFDSNSAGISFSLGQVITGWQIGIPLIQKGGKVRLLIPSGLAYGRTGSGPIPANAVLDFDIELVNVN